MNTPALIKLYLMSPQREAALGFEKWVKTDLRAGYLDLSQ